MTVLKDICVNKGKQGLEAKALDCGDTALLRITDINNDGSIGDLMYTNSEKASNYLLRENDIVFARTGNNIWKNYFYDNRDGEIAYASFLIRFSLDPQKVNPRYIKYYCQSNTFREWIRKYSHEHTRSHINISTYELMPIDLPERDKQDEIVKKLDNIEELKRIKKETNKLLYKQVELYYDKIFNKSYKTGAIKDLAKIIAGRPHKTLANGNIPCFSSGGIIRTVDKAICEKTSVLIPRKGSLNNIMYIQDPFWAGDTMFYTMSNIEGALPYIYITLKRIDLTKYNSGSSIPSLTKEGINAINFPIPSYEELNVFYQKVEPIFSIIKINQQIVKQLQNYILNGTSSWQSKQ